MPRWSVPCLFMPLALFGCGREIVLGDSESALPSTAGAGAVAGTGNTAGSASVGGTPNVAGSASLAGSGGSSDMPGEILGPGAIVWSTDHETGDVRDWEQGGSFYGGEYDWGNAWFSVESPDGRGQSQGLIVGIDTNTRGEPSQGVRVYRRIEDAPAYYSIWLKLEEAHSVSEWWSIFLFHARDDTLTLDNDVSLWDVRVVKDDNGEMTLQFFDHDTMQGTIDEQAGRIRAGEWFELSAYLDYHPPAATRLRIFHNGALLFDRKNLHTTPQNNVFWALGNGSDGLDPSESTVYLDDAAIRRAGGPP